MFSLKHSSSSSIDPSQALRPAVAIHSVKWFEPDVHSVRVLLMHAGMAEGFDMDGRVTSWSPPLPAECSFGGQL